MRGQRISCFSLLGLAAVLAALPGCSGGGSGGKGDITGEVIFQNASLPSGTITFVTENGAAFSSEISDGQYKITGCPTGPVKVTVKTYQRGGQADSKKLPKDAAIGDFAQGHENSGKKWVFKAIPPRYAELHTTDLGYEVVKGSQTKTFELSNK